MADTNMVATHSGVDDRRTITDTAVTNKSCFAKQKRRVASSSQETRVKYMLALRGKYQLKGFSDAAVDLMIKSWRKSTINQYLVYAKLWFQFSADGLLPTVRNLVEFLVYLHSKGFNQKQIRQARSAVSAISHLDNMGKQPDVKRIIKGMFEDKPHFPIYSSVWNVKILFRHLRSIPHQRELPLRILSKKLAVLLCILAGGQRSQTIHILSKQRILLSLQISV